MPDYKNECKLSEFSVQLAKIILGLYTLVCVHILNLGEIFLQKDLFL